MSFSSLAISRKSSRATHSISSIIFTLPGFVVRYFTSNSRNNISIYFFVSHLVYNFYFTYLFQFSTRVYLLNLSGDQLSGVD